MLILGKDLTIIVNGERIAYDTDCTVNISADILTVTGRTLGRWPRRRTGRAEWGVTCDALFSDAGFGRLFELLADGTECEVRFSIVGGTVYAGMARLSELDASGANGDIGGISAEFTGSGELRKLGDGGSGTFDNTFDDTFG